jgi:hypothetical protein
MEKIYQQTKDTFNVIINDFLCPHADLKEALERSSLPHYMLFTNTGTFQKTIGLQQAANAITDPNGIVVILDLHIDVPSYFVDDVRKVRQTFKYHTLFSKYQHTRKPKTQVFVQVHDVPSHW